METRRFTGRRCLVIGGAHGIGAATVRRLAEEGARVLVADLDGDAAVSLAGELPDAIGMACDVASSDSVRAVVGRAVDDLGGVDVLVCTSFSCSPDTALDSVEGHAAWTLDLDITLSGTYRACAAAFDELERSDHPAIVLVGSVNGLQDFGNHAYSAAKAGLESLTRTLAGTGAAHGIRVNLVAPGTVATRAWAGREAQLERLGRIYPLGRVGRPDDIAAAIAFLASGDAAWVTGVTLRVDGGLLAINTSFKAEGFADEGFADEGFRDEGSDA